jgi:hypothetical protein
VQELRRPAGWLLARSLAEKSGRQRRCRRWCGAASVCVRRRSREHVPPLSQPSAGASCAPPPSGSAASRPRPRRPVASSERLSFRRQTRRFRPPARSAVCFLFVVSRLGRRSVFGSDSVRHASDRRVRRPSAVFGEPLKKRRVKRASSAPS